MSNKVTIVTKADFNPRTFLSTIGKGREMVSFGKKSTIFTQGDTTDGLFFIQEGKVQLSVVSEAGKEATLGILSEGLLWRRRSGWSTQPHVMRDSFNRLRAPAC